MELKKAAALRALLELGLLFLPAIPMLLWVWPAIESNGPLTDLAQSLAYLYFAAGVVFISRKRWKREELGISLGGFWLSLACGAGLVGMVVAGRAAISIPFVWVQVPFWQMAWEVLFYLFLVGAVEELVFRGLLYRIFEDLGGAWLALIGTTVGFMLFHIGWANPLQMAGIGLVGLFFGLIRLRAGGIFGLVIVHGLYDIVNTNLFRGLDRTAVTLDSVVNRGWAIVGDILILAPLVYLLFLHPWLDRRKRAGV